MHRYGDRGYNWDVSPFITRDMNIIKLASYKDSFRFVLTNYLDYIAGCVGCENSKGYNVWENIKSIIMVESMDLKLQCPVCALAGISGVAAAKQRWNHV